ncbi:MAG: F0F1 ATP synthase subunit delta [Tissierellia bacterium]|nr:F0F1 ATP synthase subunit delta [Tissierellia bacterium]
MADLVSKRYALALFEAGMELDKINVFKDDLLKVVDVLEMEEGLQKVLFHPKVKKDEKKELVDSIFGKLVCDEMLNFLYTLIDKRREKLTLQIKKEFEKLYNEHENTIDVVAITSVEMDHQLKEKLKLSLQNRLNKKVNLENVVDKDIVGGVLLKIENKIIDGTIKGQLKEIERVIKGA